MNVSRRGRLGRWSSLLIQATAVLVFTACPPPESGNDGGVDAGTDAGQDAGVDGGTTGGDGTAGSGVSGRITYDWINALSAAEGGVELDYDGKQARPARRIRVEARVDGAAPISTVTDDDGRFSFPSIADGASVQLRALALLNASGNTPDGIAPDNCDGADWDVEVVDNTEGQAVWAMDDAFTRLSPTPNANLHAGTEWNGTDYTQRTGAPFAIADTFVTEIETICQGDGAISLPALKANWSPRNRAVSGNIATGDIGTSFYTGGPGGSSPNLYILGDDDADTDEYDDHVVAHEFGHYLEDQLYRSDSVGGQHGLGDLLDPRVAFGEGYGNALSAMTFNDPIYVDTNGARQSSGFQIEMDDAPGGNDRGVYSESSVQHVLWRLYDGRDGTPNSGRFDRIHNVLRNFQRESEALTSLHSFSAYYNAEYGGAAEGLEGLWDNTLATPYDALCAGTCSGTGDTADLWDTDNDLGIAYASSRTYFNDSQDAQFWRLYKTISGSGFSPPGDGHDFTFGSGQAHNRLGAQRWYRYVGTGTAVTATVNLTQAAQCSSDVTDLDLFRRGLIANNVETDGCPDITIPGTSAANYVLVVNSFGTDAEDGYGISIE